MPLSYEVRFGMPTQISTGGTVLNDVQSVSTSHGRTWSTDPYNPASCTIQSRNIAAWTTAPKIGDLVSVKCTTGSNVFVFSGLIKDVAITYGTVAALDEATITCEGPFSRFGRRNVTSLALAQKGTLAQVNDIITAYSLDGFANTLSNGRSTASAQTFTGNLGDLTNLLVTTEVGYMREVSAQKLIGGVLLWRPLAVFAQRNSDVTADYTFSDNPVANTEMRYDPTGISFTSAAQDYYVQVTINPQGLTSQTSGNGDYSLEQDSLDYSTGQALSHAQYLKSKYNSTASTPYEIRTNYSQQSDNATRQSTFTAFVHDAKSAPGLLIKIVFRGSTYYAIVEGRQLFADTSETGLTLTVSPQDNNNYLILNNAVFGTLGTSGTYPGNKLGF